MAMGILCQFWKSFQAQGEMEYLLALCATIDGTELAHDKANIKDIKETSK